MSAPDTPQVGRIRKERPPTPWLRGLLKAGFAAAYATLLTSLVLTSTIYQGFRGSVPPIPIPFIPNPFEDGKDLIVTLLITGLTLLPFLSKQKEMPALLALSGFVSILTTYTYSTLDWSRLLKEFGLTSPGFPPWSFLLVSALPYFLAMGLQFLDNGRLLRENFLQRGAPVGDLKGIREANLKATIEVMGATLGCFLLVSLGVFLMSGPLQEATLETGALAAPLAAGTLLAGVLAAFLWWPRRHERKRRQGATPPKP